MSVASIFNSVTVSDPKMAGMIIDELAANANMSNRKPSSLRHHMTDDPEIFQKIIDANFPKNE